MKDFVMKRYVKDEMSKFKNYYDMINFIDSLTTREVRKMGKLLSRWRHNGVYRKIMWRTDWQLSSVPVERIVIGDINDDVKRLIRENYNLLEDIAGDYRIANHKEFKSQGKIRNRVALALKYGDMFKIIDGSHRIIRLACDGEFYQDRDFLLLYSTEDEITLVGRFINWVKKKLGIYKPMRLEV